MRGGWHGISASLAYCTLDPAAAVTESRRLLQHFLAALAYRTQKALRGAPAHFAEFRAGAHVRTPHELLWHMTGVIGYARTMLHGGRFTGKGRHDAGMVEPRDGLRFRPQAAPCEPAVAEHLQRNPGRPWSWPRARAEQLVGLLRVR